MRTRLLLLILLGSIISFAQTAQLKSPQLENEFEIKLDKKKDGTLNVYIIDSKKPDISQIVTEQETSPPYMVISKTIKKINDLSKEFYYYIPNSSTKTTLNINIEKEKVTNADIVSALKKLDQITLTNLIKEKITFNLKDNKSDFSLFIAKIKVDNSFEPIFPSATETSGYVVKRINANKVVILFNGGSDVEFKPDNEADFYQKLYNLVKSDDNTLESLFAKDILKSVKDVTIDSNENVKKLEDLYNQYKGKDKITNYSYLGYVGTNFDLVDGVKAKNLFFATNILVTPKERERAGFYISLYGNRTISRIDSIPNIIRDVRVNDSIGNQYIHREKSDVVKKVQSDNLGAYFSPLIRWDFWKNKSRYGAVKTSPASFYYAPSLEFIWRRTAVDVRYINSQKLPAEQLANLQPTYSNTLSYRQNNTYNIYDFYISPIGFWLLHENETISIRLNMNVGYSTRYAPINYLTTNANIDLIDNIQDNYSNTNDIFYTGKLWITERTTGITLQGEINNTLKRSTPFYGVTLSKAFDFEKLGNFFAPISNRTTGTTK
ncbi:hypothetical protein GCM10022386_07340 [Flavobacterium cheonhonense]|uniref:Uncharacterized protein n=1 Tax=Flavobacterium cheonhonense TaxID=706185 RepID=A0ABP7TI36_9FLAO|nr:hypothetical protein [Flavobacterium cheonhonense]